LRWPTNEEKDPVCTKALEKAERGRLNGWIDVATLRLALSKARISCIIFPMCHRYTFTFSAKSPAKSFDMVP
jgi:hypothetical protein